LKKAREVKIDVEERVMARKRSGNLSSKKRDKNMPR